MIPPNHQVNHNNKEMKKHFCLVLKHIKKLKISKDQLKEKLVKANEQLGYYQGHDVNNELRHTKAVLADTKAEIGTIKKKLNDTRAKLVATEAKLADAKEELPDVQAKLAYSNNLARWLSCLLISSCIAIILLLCIYKKCVRTF